MNLRKTQKKKYSLMIEETLCPVENLNVYEIRSNLTGMNLIKLNNGSYAIIDNNILYSFNYYVGKLNFNIINDALSSNFKEFLALYYMEQSLNFFLDVNTYVNKKKEEVKEEEEIKEKLNLYVKKKKKSFLYNKFQLKSIKDCCNLNKKDSYLIQGPPGTGKTKTLLAIISIFLIKKEKLLICTPSNSAVDLIFNKINEEQIFNENLKKFIPKIYRYKGKDIKDCSNIRENNKINIEKDEDMIKNHNIIFTSFNSSGDSFLLDLSLTFSIIMDEAAQCNISTSLIPLLNKFNNLIMIGDQKQLSSFTLSPNVKKTGFTNSLFEYLYSKPQQKKIMLKMQYRMNSKICSFISSSFYNSKLINSIFIQYDYSLNDIYRIVKNTHYFSFINIPAQNCFEYNVKEAQEIYKFVKLLDFYFESSLVDFINYPKKTVGIITPYQEQKEVLNSKFNNFKSENFILTINTIDSFQGGEADIIIFSFVKSQLNSFLYDKRRLNVAFSRAKFCLFVFGDKNLINTKIFNDEKNILGNIKPYCKCVESENMEEEIFLTYRYNQLNGIFSNSIFENDSMDLDYI